MITEARLREILGNAAPSCGLLDAIDLGPATQVDCLVSMTAAELWELHDEIEEP